MFCALKNLYYPSSEIYQLIFSAFKETDVRCHKLYFIIIYKSLISCDVYIIIYYRFYLKKKILLENNLEKNYFIIMIFRFGSVLEIFLFWINF